MREAHWPMPQFSYMIATLDRLIHKHLDKSLKEIGLTLPQFTALSVLYEKKHISNAKLAELSFIRPQSANKILQELQQNGWINKYPDPEHGRRLLIELTPAGHNILQQGNICLSQLEKRMTEGMNIHMAFIVKDNLKLLLNNLRVLPLDD